MAKSLEKVLQKRENDLLAEMLRFYEEVSARFDLIDEKKSNEYKNKAVKLKMFYYEQKL